MHPSLRALTLLLLFLLEGWAPAQGKPPGRYELGRRLRAFETAWSQCPEARARSLDDLEGAVGAFLVFDLDRAAAGLDRARWRLRTAADPEPAATWGASLDLLPEARFIALGTRRLRLSLGSAYAPKPRRPPGATVLLRVLDGEGKTELEVARRAINGIPHDFEIAVGGLSPGDHRLQAEIACAGAAPVVLEQVLSVARNPRERLRRIREVAQRHRGSSQRSLRATLDLQAGLLERLLDGRSEETDIASWSLLQEAEAGALALRAGAPFHGPARSGSFRLQLATRRGWVPARVFVPSRPPGSAPPPLVVALHGTGGSENLFFEAYGRGKIVDLCRARGWMLVAPRVGVLTTVGVADIVDEVAELFPVGPVFLVGHSIGARRAVAAAISSPERYRAMAALGGGGTGALRRMIRVPVFIGAGDHDFALPWARRLHAQLIALGARDATLRVYPGVEHMMVVAEALPDAFALFDRVLR